MTAPGTKQCEGDFDTPGDGLPLDGVNPAYNLVNLRPAGFEPKVTGLEWMGDDLLVLTWGDDDGDPSSVTAAGEVWKLTGVKTATNPSTVTRTKLAEGLKEPMGIKVVDGEIYISEKDQLVKLVNPNANGVYEGKTRIATWPFDGNFHEFAFGLLYKDGFFYLNLSVSINLGGATTVPQGSRRPRHAAEDQQGHGRGRVRRRRPAHAARHRLGSRELDLHHRQPGRLAARPTS